MNHRSERRLIVCGAGISMDPPACAPGVWHIMQLARRLLLPDENRVDRHLSDLVLGKVQPELFFERVAALISPNYLEIWNVVDSSVTAKSPKLTPNLCHYFVVWLAAEHGTPIITMNFDVFLEDAARDLGIKMPRFVPGVASSGSVLECVPEPGSTALWKVHGSLEVNTDGGKPSICTTMSQIVRRNRRLLDALSAWAAMSRLHLVGYSGRDADFFPELAGLTRRSFGPPLWIDPNHYVDPGMEERCSALRAIPVPERFLDWLFKAGSAAFIDALRSCKSASVESAIKAWEAVRRGDSLAGWDEHRNMTLKTQEEAIIRKFGKVDSAARRALLVSLLLYSGSTREGYLYEKRYLRSTKRSLKPETLAILMLDRARLCDWNSKYEQYRQSCCEALEQAQFIRSGSPGTRDAELIARVGGLCLLARAEHMLMGPFMAWPDQNLSDRANAATVVKSLLLHLKTSARVRFAMLTHTRGKTGRVPSFLRSIWPAQISPSDPENLSIGESIAWAYYLDHRLVFGLLALRALTSLARFRFARAVTRFLALRFVDRLEAGVQSAGTAYTLADLYVLRARFGDETEVMWARHIWKLVGHSIGVALILRDQGAEMLRGWPPNVCNSVAADRFRQCYEISVSAGSHLTALKAMIGLHHAGIHLERTRWDYHSNKIEGSEFVRFFARAADYLQARGAFNTPSVSATGI